MIILGFHGLYDNILLKLCDNLISQFSFYILFSESESRVDDDQVISRSTGTSPKSTERKRKRVLRPR